MFIADGIARQDVLVPWTDNRNAVYPRLEVRQGGTFVDETLLRNSVAGRGDRQKGLCQSDDEIYIIYCVLGGGEANRCIQVIVATVCGGPGKLDRSLRESLPLERPVGRR